MEKKLDEYFNQFMTEKKCYCEPKTIDYYYDNLGRFVEFVADRRLTRDVYVEYVAYLRSTGIKNSSIRTYCRAIKSFIHWLEDNHYIDNDITYKVRLPRNDSSIVMPLSQEEVDTIDQVFNDRDQNIIHLRNYIMIHLMLDCGLRLSEVVHLKHNDLDFNKNIIYIRNSKYNKNRIVLLLPDLRDPLLQYINLPFPSVCSKPLFIKSDGSPISMSVCKNLFRKLKLSTGIIRLHPHLLRHTFATSYIMSGGDLEKLRILLGHADYGVTKNYLHISAQQLLLHYDIYKINSVYFEKK